MKSMCVVPRSMIEVAMSKVFVLIKVIKKVGSMISDATYSVNEILEDTIDYVNGCELHNAGFDVEGGIARRQVPPTNYVHNTRSFTRR